MELSPATSSLLSELVTFSSGKITRPSDLGILLESGKNQPERGILDELGFYAKFLHRTYGIMARIGREGEGYDRLSGEFSGAVTKARNLLSTLVAGCPAPVREHFGATYLAMTQGGLDNLLSLCHDLGWYKNWLIDTQRQRNPRI
jgi:hypothetical protein